MQAGSVTFCDCTSDFPCFLCGKVLEGPHYDIGYVLGKDELEQEFICKDCWEGEAGILWRLSQ